MINCDDGVTSTGITCIIHWLRQAVDGNRATAAEAAWDLYSFQHVPAALSWRDLRGGREGWEWRRHRLAQKVKPAATSCSAPLCSAGLISIQQ